MKTKTALEEELRSQGFAFARGGDLRASLGGAAALTDWEAFAASWNDLKPDTYIPEERRDRLRRHAVLTAEPGGAPVLAPPQPHYQSPDYNKVYGGIERWFEPIRPEIAQGPTMRRLLDYCGALFGRLRPGAAWKIELHQFRIEARPGRPGQPTPEGLHRDGVDLVLAMLVRRQNIASGTTVVHGLAGEPVGSFTLEQPLDAAFVDDTRVMHGVTPVTPLDPSQPAFRDVLVATFLKR